MNSRDHQPMHVLNRRRLLEVGTLGTLGLTFRISSPPRRSHRKRAGRRLASLFSSGAVPVIWIRLDPKPDAPAEVRGEFHPIATNVPGTIVCEHLPQIARRMDRVAVIRSLSHDDAAHLSSGHATVTGHWAPVVKSDQDPPSEKDTPHMGAVLAKLRPSTGELPAAVMVPWKVFHPAAPGGRAPGQHGGWLGKKYDPFLVTGDPNAPGWNVPELVSAGRPHRAASRPPAGTPDLARRGPRPIGETGRERVLDRLSTASLRPIDRESRPRGV